MAMQFQQVMPPHGVSEVDFASWTWQAKHSLKTLDDFEQYFTLSPEERLGFEGLGSLFQVRVTPYYAQLATGHCEEDPIRKILMPHQKELLQGQQQMLDPLGERRHSGARRIIHRYPDRVLFLVTDFCSVYCRYCTRKHFTGQDQVFPKRDEYDEALTYIRSHPGVREVILSGGDPLSLSEGRLVQVLSDLRSIEHVEIIRLGTRFPVVAPMRITESLVQALKPFQPIFIMTHFNHPREITQQAAAAVVQFVDNGFPVMNQMVLLNGVNNHPAHVQALSRRLLYLRVKPYYMFQCDPSEGTDHLRTTVDHSLEIQRQLWGRLSGLAMPSLSLDIPDGGGKVGLVPDFLIEQQPGRRIYKGWDGQAGEYIDPTAKSMQIPADLSQYIEDWQQLLSAEYGHQTEEL